MSDTIEHNLKIEWEQYDTAPDLVGNLSVHQFGDPVSAFREAVSNAFDAEGSDISKYYVEIKLSPEEITIEDWGHGIKDFYEFKAVGTSKKDDPKSAIGRFGVGKQSLLMLGDLVEYVTNNGKYGMRIYLHKTKISKPIYGAVDEFLSHQGTKIIISKPKEIPSYKKIVDEIRKRFVLKILQGAKVVINGEEIYVKPKFNPEETTLFKLKNNTIVSGNLMNDEEGNGSVDVYVKHTFVENISIDPSRAFSGWVNCDGLDLSWARNEIRQDTLFKELFAKLRELVIQRFKTREISTSEFEKKFNLQVNKLMSDFLKEHGWIPINSIIQPNHKGKKQTPELIPDLEGDKKLGVSRGGNEADTVGNSQNAKETSKQQPAELKERPLIDLQNVEAGKNMPPLYRDRTQPHIIYSNTTHPLQIHLSNKKEHGRYISTKEKLGCLAPYLGGILVRYNPEYDRMSDEQKEAEANQYTLQILYSAKVLSDEEMSGNAA